MQNARLDEAQAGIKIAGGNVNNLRYADDTTLMAESEELKSLLTSKITMIFISSYQKSNWYHFQNHNKVQVNSSAHRRHCV